MCLPITPYKVEREWVHAGLQCSVVLSREAGHRCGYVRVPPGHPLHGVDYDTPEVDVHGGLTFAELEPCDEHPDGKGWWFGFDCAHAFDASFDPDIRIEDMKTNEGRALAEIRQRLDGKFPRPEGWNPDHYWSEGEVAAECECLAEQLSAISAAASGSKPDGASHSR